MRIPEICRKNILKPLDSGATGLLVPQVNTAEEAKEVVRHSKYPPAGNRGVAVRRAHSLYANVDAIEYLQKANDDTFIAVQAESPQAIENIDAIASVDGIDCIFAGPLDLSVSLGIPGQISHPREVDAIEKIIAACRNHNKVAGIHMFDTELLAHWIEKGMRFITYSADVALLADAAANAVKDLKNIKY